MRCKNLLSILALSSLANAVPYQRHQHVKHRREAIAEPEPEAYETMTLVVTQVVYQNQFNPSTLETKYTSSSSSTAADSTNYVETSTTSASPVSSEATEESSSSTSASLSASSSASSSSTSSSAPSASPSNDFSAGSVESYAVQGKGITYSPYTDSGSCKSSDVITSDIEKLSSFSIIRIYAPDCSSVSTILGAMTSSQKLFAGLFYMNSLDSDIDLLTTQVEGSSRGWDAIYAVAVGNEWVNSGDYSASEVVTAVNSARSTLKSKGFTGSVVTVDTVPAYQNNPSLCGCTDFAAVNSHPFWDGNTAPADSGSFLQDQLTNVGNLCNKDVLICETGWPTQGDTYGAKGVPGVSQQLEAVESITNSVANSVIFFTTYNDLWKAAGSYGVEQYWGIFSS